jgi:hypothetical protein
MACRDPDSQSEDRGAFEPGGSAACDGGYVIEPTGRSFDTQAWDSYNVWRSGGGVAEMPEPKENPHGPGHSSPFLDFWC